MGQTMKKHIGKPSGLREDCYCEKHDAFCCPECKEEILTLEARLSHLMDVAGKMAGALEYCASPYMQRITPFADIEARIFSATKALAEWDGIKDGQHEV
jgi:hypothetical protein